MTDPAFTRKRPVVIVGIDPGSRVTGFAAIRLDGDEMTHLSHGIFRLPAKSPLPERLAELSQDLAQVLSRYKPDHVVVEKVFLGKNVDSAFTLGHARGVVLLEAARHKAQVFEYSTRSVKKGVTGQGGADKAQVQLTLQRIFQLPQMKMLDASDALALATYHGSRYRGFQHRSVLEIEEKDL